MEGYEVCGAVTLAEVQAICQAKHVDLTIFGASVGPRLKVAIADVLFKHGSATRIIEIGQSRPFLPKALAIADSSGALVQAVRVVLNNQDVPGQGLR
jgi:hypothetical protein